MLTRAASGRPLSADLVVRVGGTVVPVELWDRVRPKTGACITVTREALAGGGDGWKQVLGAVVLIAVSVLSYGWGASLSTTLLGTSAYAGAFAGAITMVAGCHGGTLIAVPAA